MRILHPNFNSVCKGTSLRTTTHCYFCSHNHPPKNWPSFSLLRPFISIKVSDFARSLRQTAKHCVYWSEKNFRVKTFSFPFQRTQTFLPARRETVIKFHELLAPVNLRGVKSKFKLCTESDPIPLYLDG
jgi:hypothetical protein